VPIGAEHMDGRETDLWVANVPADVARLFRACLCSVAHRLSTGPGAVLEAMFDHAIDTWWVSTPRAHRVFERDGWRCLTTLCAAHHQRGVHGGVIRISGRALDALVFELPLGRFHSGDRCA
jgi:hypothetical protein